MRLNIKEKPLRKIASLINKKKGVCYDMDTTPPPKPNHKSITNIYTYVIHTYAYSIIIYPSQLIQFSSVALAAISPLSTDSVLT